MEWDSAFSVGIEEIDCQHKILLTHFKSVEQALAEENDWSDTHFALLKLTDYASYHFHFEESLMRLFGYHDVDNHATQHQFYLKQLSKKTARVLNSDSNQELLSFLKDWIISHIQGTDREYANHIRQGANVVLSSSTV